MLGDAQRHSRADAQQFAFEALVDEWHQAPAVLADHVVVVAVSVAEWLVANDSLADLDPHEQLGLLELLEDPVDARARDRALVALEGILDLDRRERTVLLGEESDHLAPRAATAISRLRETACGVLGPATDCMALGGHLTHPRARASGREVITKASA